MSTEATIRHADLDAFYASVEQRDHPRWRGRPLIVGTGVVLAASYEARRRGIRTAMGGRQARLLCPDAVVVEPRMSAYSAASKAVFEVFRSTTPLVEGISIDEAFLDVGGLARSPARPRASPGGCARRYAGGSACPSRSAWPAPSSWRRWPARSPSPTACWSSRPTGNWRSCTRCRWSCCGGGSGHRRQLHERRIHTVGHVARIGEAALVAILGQAAGRHLHALAHNRDPRPVLLGRRRSSIGAQRAMGRGPRSPAELDAAATALVDRVTRRMRSAGRAGLTVTLRLRSADYSRATRSRTLPRATANTRTILDAVRDLLAAAQPIIAERGITLVGISVGNFGESGAVQLELPLDAHYAPEIDDVVDAVRDRFGTTALLRAGLLGHDPGLSVPLLPD